MKINISTSHYLGNDAKTDTKTDNKADSKAGTKEKSEDGVRTLDGTFVPWSRILNLLKRGAK